MYTKLMEDIEDKPQGIRIPKGLRTSQVTFAHRYCNTCQSLSGGLKKHSNTKHTIKKFINIIKG